MPWDKWFFEDLDRDCGVLTLRARGGWVWIIGDLREHEGERSLTLEGWAKIMRCNQREAAQVLTELIDENICDCIEGQRYISVRSNANLTKPNGEPNGKITLRCRRIYRESKSRKDNRLRQQRFYEKHGPNVNLTDDKRKPNAVRSKKQEAESYKPLCIPPCETPPKNGPENTDQKLGERFQILFEKYPPHRRTSMQQEALFEFCALKPDQAMFDRMLSALETQKASEEWTEKNSKYVPGLLKWIRGRGWEAVTATMRPARCRTCAGIGVVCRDGEKLFPWSEELAWGRELKSEICPDCKGKNRLYPPPPGCPL